MDERRLQEQDRCPSWLVAAAACPSVLEAKKSDGCIGRPVIRTADLPSCRCSWTALNYFSRPRPTSVAGDADVLRIERADHTHMSMASIAFSTTGVQACIVDFPRSGWSRHRTRA